MRRWFMLQESISSTSAPPPAAVPRRPGSATSSSGGGGGGGGGSAAASRRGSSADEAAQQGAADAAEGVQVAALRSMSTPRMAKFQRLLDEQVVDLEALRELSWSGIPPSLRPTCWRLLLGYLPPNRERRAQASCRGPVAARAPTVRPGLGGTPHLPLASPLHLHAEVLIVQLTVACMSECGRCCTGTYRRYWLARGASTATWSRTTMSRRHRGRTRAARSSARFGRCGGGGV
jgi:hypothetical protein